MRELGCHSKKSGNMKTGDRDDVDSVQEFGDQKCVIRGGYHQGWGGERRSLSLDGGCDAPRRQLGDGQTGRCSLVTHYKAANIENEYSRAAPLFHCLGRTLVCISSGASPSGSNWYG